MYFSTNGGDDMFCNDDLLSYAILIPPINKPFSEFNSTETRQFFEWYIESLDDRIRYLEEFSCLALDFSHQSLEIIWEWFLQVATVTSSLRCQEKEIKQSKTYFRPGCAMPETAYGKLSLETEYIIRDIAMYVGKMFTLKHKSIFWTYHTDVKKDSFANMPILSGFIEKEAYPYFCPVFEPNHMVRVQAFRLLHGKANKKDLHNLYTKWEAKI